MSQAETTQGQGYYTTSYAIGTGTTSTPVLMIWRTLNSHLINHGLPLTGEELSARTGAPIATIERIFGQTYYQRYYGFRRFDTLEQWREWAESSELLFIPDLHGYAEDEADPEDELADDTEEESPAVAGAE